MKMLAILGGPFRPLALGYLGVLPGVVVLIAEVAILLIVAWRFDRGRDPEPAPRFLDANRSDLASPMADHTMYAPKEASSVPRTGPPPTDPSESDDQAGGRSRDEPPDDARETRARLPAGAEDLLVGERLDRCSPRRRW